MRRLIAILMFATFLPSLGVLAEPTKHQSYFIGQKASLHDLALFKANLRAEQRLEEKAFLANGFFSEVMNKLDWEASPSKPYKDQDFYVPFGQDWMRYNSYEVGYDFNEGIFTEKLELRWELSFSGNSNYGIVRHTKNNAKLLCLPLLAYVAKNSLLKSYDFGHFGYTTGSEPDRFEWLDELEARTRFVVSIKHTDSNVPKHRNAEVFCRIMKHDYDELLVNSLSLDTPSLIDLLESKSSITMQGDWSR